MAPVESLGEFEFFVLVAIAHLGQGAYGMLVRQEIVERTGRDVSIGAVYATLERLETKGCIRAAAASGTAERGGRAKRFFRLTAQGDRAMRGMQTQFQRMIEGLGDA